MCATACVTDGQIKWPVWVSDKGAGLDPQRPR